jgi:hypothetical protein
VACQSVDAALLAVDHADRRTADEPGLPERLYRLPGRTAGGDDVLDQADALPRLEHALEPVPGAVLLGLLAHDQEREARLERGGGGQGDRSELGAAEQVGLGVVRGDRGRDARSERAQELRPGLEAVLVEVVARPAAGAGATRRALPP